MRLKLPTDLLAVNVSTLLLIIVISLLPSDVLRIILGLPFVLFFPGYTLISALFHRKRLLSAIERVALSFALSIAVVPLIGLILNYTWEITLYPILTSVSLFILGTSVVAFYRRWRLPQDERFEPRLRINMPRWGESRLDRGLTLLLILSVVGAIGTLGYVIATPKVGERFTEFYILGLDGKAENYPRELTLGEYGRVILGIVNQEDETTEYRVEIAFDGEMVEKIGSLILDHEGEAEQEVSFAPVRAGPNQKVEFQLYRGVSAELYQTLHLWIDVKEAP